MKSYMQIVVLAMAERVEVGKGKQDQTVFI